MPQYVLIDVSKNIHCNVKVDVSENIIKNFKCFKSMLTWHATSFFFQVHVRFFKGPRHGWKRYPTWQLPVQKCLCGTDVSSTWHFEQVLEHHVFIDVTKNQAALLWNCSALWARYFKRIFLDIKASNVPVTLNVTSRFFLR